MKELLSLAGVLGNYEKKLFSYFVRSLSEKIQLDRLFLKTFQKFKNIVTHTLQACKLQNREILEK